MSMYKVVLVDNGTTIIKISGQDPVKLAEKLFKLAVKKYGGV